MVNKLFSIIMNFYEVDAMEETDIREIIDYFVGQGFDSNIIKFKKHHKEEIDELLVSLQDGSSEIQQLRTPILRNSFLYGCALYTRHEPVEHLILGYGKLRGGGTDVYSIQHIIGEEDCVNIPPEVEGCIHLNTIRPGSEVLIFHNHPSDSIDNLFNRPFPSSADRTNLLHTKFANPLQLFNRFFSTGEVRYYLGSEGRVIEIRGASLTGILDFFNKNV